MKKNIFTIGFIAAIIHIIIACVPSQRLEVQGLDYCVQQVKRTLNEIPSSNNGKIDFSMMPKYITTDGTSWRCHKASKEEWCGGFWPGILWYCYEYSQDKQILEYAEKYTASLEFLSKEPAYDHDLGFLIFCSYGNGYRLTKNPHYKEVILSTADSLATLYNSKVGTILSWPREVKEFGGHNTIIDNMMNLELLCWAAKNGGSPYLMDIAISHADKTMQYMFREDYSSYHVAIYDTLTGNFVRNETHQGYAKNSMWARGQAWAIYGFTMMYRETKDPKYLKFVQNVADIYIKRLPSNYIPYWDFDDPTIPNSPYDSSAASITASALLELSTFLPGNKRNSYKDAAIKMLESLSSEKFQARKKNTSFLIHATGNHPAGTEIDFSIIYGDYYYIEALSRLKHINEQNM